MRLPKPLPPEAKNTRNIMKPARKAAQPKLVVPEEALKEPLRKKPPKQVMREGGMGRKKIVTVEKKKQ